MTDILPFKRRDFCGNLEVQGRLVAISKELRIRRLKEVREKEKNVSDIRAEAYRRCIEDRKAAKELNEKNAKRKEKERELQTLSKKWQNAVLESGAAHERAKKNVDILFRKSEADSKVSIRRHEEEVRREKAALKLRQEQYLETQRPSMRLLEMQQTKREIRMSDREDAHANGEAYSARRQLLACQREAVAHIRSVPVVYTQTRVQQGAVSIEQRFPVEVHAQVWRHGVRGAGGTGIGGRYRAEVRNGAHVEEVTILKKTWSKVMGEMLTKIKTKKRAQTAKRTVEQHKGVLYLESELQRLEAADKAPSRQTRVCSSLDVVPDAEAPRLQGAFEKMFLSKPVRLDNKHIVYSTGSHLVKANLEKHVQHQHAEEDGEAAEHFPTWQTQLPTDNFGSSPFYPATSNSKQSNEDLDSLRSSTSSGALSDELHVLHRSGMYRDLDGCSTASDIPMISRPPPHWTAVSQDLLPNTLHLNVTQEHNQQGTYQQNVEVRIPQVQQQAPGVGPTPKRTAPASPSPSSPSSVATSPSSVFTSGSSFSDAVSMKSSMENESSSQWIDPPLSLQIKGVLDTVPTGSVTPPRHQSSRGAGPRPIDPFTPPEVIPSKRQQQANQRRENHSQQRHVDEAGSPHSGTSSTNTEQARHDRLQHYEQNQGKLSLLNESTLSEQSGVLPPSAPMRGGAARSPLWTEDSDVDRSRESVNVSALTEQLLQDDSDGEEGDVNSTFTSASSSTISELIVAKRALSSSSDDHSPSASIGFDPRKSGPQITSSLASSSSSSTRSATSTSATGSLRSSTSSSSSSMLSYLDSNKKPVASSATHPTLHTSSGVTITLATGGLSRAPVRSGLAPSPSQSLESDSVSMLSTTSDEIRFAARSTTANSTMRDSFAQLIRQELLDVLDDIGEASAEEIEDVDQEGVTQRYVPLPHASAWPGAPEPSQRGDDSGSRDLSSDARDYASMYDSDDDDQVQSSVVASNVAQSVRSFPLSYAIDRIVEEEDEGELSSKEELDQISLQSTSTGELFDNWQQLYKGTLQLGSEARALRSQHVTAYNASSATATAALSEGESFLSSEEGSPPRRVTHSQPHHVPASPLNVLVFPADGPEFSKSSLFEADLHSSQSSHSTVASDNSRSSDSLSPRKVPSLSAHSQVRETIVRTSVDVRSSYESSNRATALMSELDKLTQDWREKQAFYAKPSHAPPTEPSREDLRVLRSSASAPQPAELPHFASPSWPSSHKYAAEPTVPTSHTPASLSSLSAAASPPEETTDAAKSTQWRNVYTGTLLVHSEQRSYPVTAAHLPDLAAQLELEDSMNSSGIVGPQESFVGAAGTTYSSDDEDAESEDRSLADLLNSHGGSETRGRIQSEIAAMRNRLLATVGTSTTTTSHLGFHELRTHTSESPKTDVAKSSSRSAGALSSGEDTYSSSKYFSASEARNTSGSTIRTAHSDIGEPVLRSTSRALTAAQATTSISHASSNTRYAHYSVRQSSNREADERMLHDDSSRADTYSFTKRSPAPPPHQNIGSTASTESSLLLQQMGSPGAASVSRLSEYAMLSQHTLQTSRDSPGEGTSPAPTRYGHMTDASYSYEYTNRANASSASDSSTFSEYMRHFPSKN